MYNESIRSCRLDAGKTQREVADTLHVSQQVVAKWENGVGSEPSISRLIALADIYNVSIDKLIGRE